MLIKKKFFFLFLHLLGSFYNRSVSFALPGEKDQIFSNLVTFLSVNLNRSYLSDRVFDPFLWRSGEKQTKCLNI